MTLFDLPANRAALARGHAAMAEQARVFEAFAGAAIREPEPLMAAVVAQVAFSYVNRRHPGYMVHAGLEAKLNAIGREQVPGRADAARRAGAERERVLHVITRVFDTGGHSRVMQRWIERDVARESAVLFTSQPTPLPLGLRETLEATGTPALWSGAGTLIERARDLRRLAADYDYVVLHTSPFEVVPALAFADPVGRPPTIAYNHASHHLWAGVGATDVVANLWRLDADDAVARRGVPRERSLILPLPATPAPLPERSAARAALGLPQDAPVLLSAASPYKYDPVLEPTFATVVAELVERLPDLHVVIAGPGPEHDAIVPSHPRVRAFGPVPDLGAHLAAADLLLDSWPASGATMMLDAAAAGLPCLALGGGNPAVDLIRPPAGLFDGTVTNAADVDALVVEARALLDDAPRRRNLSERLAAYVVREHEGDGWRAAMEAVFAAAREHHGAARVPDAPPPGPASDSEAVLQLLYDVNEGEFSAYKAFTYQQNEMPAHRHPRSGALNDQHVDVMLAAHDAGAPRAVASPALDGGTIVTLVQDARRLHAGGEIASLVVAVEPARVALAAELLTAALDGGPELDVELIGAPELDVVRAPGDVVLG